MKRLLLFALTAILTLGLLNSCKKDVGEVRVTGVTLNKSAISLTEGDSVVLTATVAPADADNKNVTWKSDKAAIADVDAKGKVSAIKAGTAVITVSTVDGDKTDKCIVTVTASAIAVTGVTLDKDMLMLAVSDEATLIATIIPENPENPDVTWGSSAPDIATVDAAGNVKAMAPGEATITVTTVDGGKTASCLVTVRIAPTGVSLDEGEITLYTGMTKTLTATVLPENATNRNVSWGSSNPDVATVDDLGNVKAMSIGKANITVTTADGGKTDFCVVTVESYPSGDGVVTVMQEATVGNGIDIVLMGDGYTDRLIADGTYAEAMSYAVESFFAVEPYISHRDYFNIYVVNAVSENEGITPGKSTALECQTSSTWGSLDGNRDKCRSYVLQAIPESRIDEATVIVLVNDPSWQAVCVMYFSASSGDWGSGMSISYCTVGTRDWSGDDGWLRRTVLHEAGGHGFAKLSDEYWSDGGGTAITQHINEIIENHARGWSKNIDYISDPNGVRWAKFLTDSRYAGQGLGVYEGGNLCKYGIYRATDNSFMRSSYSTEINAPSREAIYYRIHKLAYGAGWVYNYEAFAAWDLSHRSETSKMQAVSAGPLKSVPHKPPIIIKSP